MDDPSRPSRSQDERRNIEEEEEVVVEVEKMEEEVASISRDTAENRTSDVIGRTALRRDNVNGTCNNIGEPAAGRADQVANREQTEDHQRLNSQFRELREVMPPIPRTGNSSMGNTGTGAGVGAGAGAAAGPLPGAEQNSYHGDTSARGVRLASATAMEEEDEEEADLLDCATLRILWLQREQRILQEQNDQLQSLLDDRTRQQHEREPDNDQDEA